MALSGQITVTTAGTAVKGTNEPGRLFSIIAHPDNTDTVWIGNDGSEDITNLNSYPLNAAGSPIILALANLNQVWVDADVNAGKVCWIKLE